jgi:rfaE bifunctional protein kinase chain/domain
VDREPDGLGDATVEALVRKARERIGDVRAVLISDYGYGSATPEIVASIRSRKRWARPVALDSRYRLHEYAGLDLTAATPNEAEIEAAHNARIGGDAAKLDAFARRTMARLNLSALVVTRGRHGMTVFERGRAPHPIAVFGSDQAVDVTGAGDTVIAAFTLALAAGATVLQAARIANYAGGIVVMKRGTATVTREELIAAIRSDAESRRTEAEDGHAK